ncbi:MAG TPA: DUF4350 domain-containing protein [Candidatus Angelobacter sp.]|jgi:hypothetical protein|nr:DUF4350 domain-containing protein [Candidatus Angelobacter sp.]
MQITLDKSDRKLVMWVGIILLPVIAALVFFSSQEQHQSTLPTSYSAEPSGAKAAYLYLSEEGYRVERWEHPPTELPPDAHKTILVLAAPLGVPKQDEKNALLLYLRRGGKILATGYFAFSFLPRTNLLLEYLPDAVWKEYPPVVLSPLTRGGAIKMSPVGYWGVTDPDQIVHYAHQGKGIVVSYKIGEGEVIWWGAETPLTNAGIQESGNLGLLLNSLGNSKDVRILWDEYFHSFHFETTDYNAPPAIRYGLFLQCALVLLALLFTYSRRHAPIRPVSEPSRLSPLEFVHTLGSLYRRVNATDVALEVPYHRFRSLLTRRLGLRPDTTSDDLARAVRNRLGYKDNDLETTLKQIEASSRAPDLTEAQVLDLVQRLSRHAHNMKLIPQEEEGEHSA